MAERPAKNKKSGTNKWEKNLGKISSKPIIAKDSVISGFSDGAMYAFDIDSGEEKWSYKLPASVEISELHENILYACSENNCYAFDTVNQELICGIDIKDYFPSIINKRVWGFFKSIGYNEIMAKNFTNLTTYRGQLPQGAPTSPMIANLISWRMDKRLANFCERRGLKYSRYADDITISGDHSLPRYLKLISKIIESEGTI